MQSIDTIEIKNLFVAHGYESLLPAAAPVLDAPEFSTFPASVGPPGGVPYHHGHVGGLAQHTREVMRLALTAAKAANFTDMRALMLGALWHDSGKMSTYQRVAQSDTFTKNPVHHLHHITCGLMMWGTHGVRTLRECRLTGTEVTDIYYRVALMISSHHGTREWGTLDAPVTHEAVILHHADMQSLLLNGGRNPYARS